MAAAPEEGILIVRGDGPADRDAGRLKGVGDVDNVDLKSRLTTESALATPEVLLDWSVRGLAAVRRDVDSIPLREGGLGTAMLLKVGVLPLELGAGKPRPCLGGSAGTISPTSSNKSSPPAGKRTA